MERRHLFVLWCLLTIVGTTVAWWALALWPVPADGPDWVLRTRAVCFGRTASGLPAVEGWLLLIFQPVSMTVALLLGWGRTTREAVRILVRSVPGRLAAVLTTVVVVLGAAGATVRVANASSADPAMMATPATSPATHPRLDLPAPTPLALVDQSGAGFDLGRYSGVPVLVTFAFGKCETVCPVLVREVLEARRLAAAEGTPPPVVVVTVDPWRDAPARLPHVARMWGLEAETHVLSGAVDRVLAELEAWDVAISRDPRTGEVVHPALVYVLGPDGRIDFAATGGAAYLAALVDRARAGHTAPRPATPG